MKTKFFIINMVVFLLVGTVVGRVVYRFFTDPILYSIENPLFEEVSEQKINHLVEREGVFESLPTGAYDFSTMIDLVEAAKEVKKRWRGTDDVLSNPDTIHMLLRQLELERSRLRDYIGDLKGHVRSGLPVKRERSLQYYMQVLEGAIIDVREVMQKDIIFAKEKGKS